MEVRRRKRHVVAGGVLPALVFGLGLAGCASAPKPPVWPEFGRTYIYEMDTGPRYELTFESTSRLSWKRTDGKQVTATGGAGYRFVRLQSGMVFLAWREKDGTAITQVVDSFSGDVTMSVSRPGGPTVVSGRVRTLP
jgi:hypothetical protein